MAGIYNNHEGEVFEFPLPAHREFSDDEKTDIYMLLTLFTRISNENRKRLVIETARHFVGDHAQTNVTYHEEKLKELFEKIGGPRFHIKIKDT